MWCTICGRRYTRCAELDLVVRPVMRAVMRCGDDEGYNTASHNLGTPMNCWNNLPKYKIATAQVTLKRTWQLYYNQHRYFEYAHAQYLESPLGPHRIYRQGIIMLDHIRV